MLPLACGRAGYYYCLIIHLTLKINLIIKSTIETILKCVKNKVYTNSAPSCYNIIKVFDEKLFNVEKNIFHLFEVIIYLAICILT